MGVVMKVGIFHYLLLIKTYLLSKVIKLKKFLNKEPEMDSLFLTGSGASGILTVPSGLAAVIKNVQIDFPSNNVGNTDPTVTLSGSITGAMSIHSSLIDINKAFTVNESVNITTNFTADTYSVLISYIYAGNQEPIMVSKTRMVMPSSFRS